MPTSVTAITFVPPVAAAPTLRATPESPATRTSAAADDPSQVSRFGARLGGFLKFYAVPGFSHGFGPFDATYDALPAIMAWVEHGTAPKKLQTIDANDGNLGRTRPLCEYPTWPKLTGKDQTKASSFTCVTR